MFDSYYKFCFERNPYDKAISLYYYTNGDQKHESIEAFIRDGGLSVVRGYDQYTISTQVAVDSIFKFEEMDKALEQIAETVGLERPLRLPRFRAKSKSRKDKRPYQEVLTTTERRLIETVWAREIALLGYHF
jgi:hypothetical protein